MFHYMEDFIVGELSRWMFAEIRPTAPPLLHSALDPTRAARNGHVAESSSFVFRPFVVGRVAPQFQLFSLIGYDYRRFQVGLRRARFRLDLGVDKLFHQTISLFIGILARGMFTKVG